MTKAQVITGITAKTAFAPEPVEKILDQFFKTVMLSLEQGEDVFFRGFGTFQVKKRNATVGRDIRRNTMMIVPEHFIPLFRPAEEFKLQVGKSADSL